MEDDKAFHWTGPGRWLGFALAGVMLLISIPMLDLPDFGIETGLLVFQALMIVGNIASGSKRAPEILMAVTILLLLNLLGSVLLIPRIPVELTLVALTGFAALVSYLLYTQREASSARG